MEQEINLKYQKFQKECAIFINKFALCQKIVAKMTDAIFEDEVREEAKFETHNKFNKFLQAVKRNLDIFTTLIEHHNETTDNSFTELVPFENDLALFTFNQCNVKQYAENKMGECVITQIGDVIRGRCYINDLKRPRPQLYNVREKNLTKFPESGEIFGIGWKDQELLRAVRSDLIFREQEKIILYLLDIGKRVEIPYDLERFYLLPEEFCVMESQAVPCNVVELFDENGCPLDVQANLQDICSQTAYFNVKKVENNVLWISLWLKQTEEANEILNDKGSDLDQYEMEVENNEIINTGDENEENSFHTFNSNEMTMAESVFVCDICDCNFVTHQEIELHMNVHIPQQTECQVKTNNAEQNMRKFRKRSSFRKDHVIVYTETYKIKCKFCNKVFSQVIDLKHHLKTHKGKKIFVCDTCGKLFTTKQCLKDHLNSHTKERSYTCKTCGKVFYNVTCLRMHSKIHSGVKFGCHTCGKEFTLKSNLNIHSRSHTGERPYICAVCNKGFTHSSNLSAHMRQIHQ